MEKLKLLLWLAAFLPVVAQAAVEHLMPPVKCIEVNSGAGFALNRHVAVSGCDESTVFCDMLANIGLTADSSASATVRVEIVDEIPGSFNHRVYGFPDEAYSLIVGSDEIVIRALNQIGALRAAQTLCQLAMERTELSPVRIMDWPAFKVRGFMHDVGRSFLPIDELKREIDLLSRFKVNVFHWHLTDYTGWRLEIRAYPQLTGDRSITRYPGCYYTQSDARELQEYAAARGVTIIPEIDMPGHSHPFCNVMGHTMLTEDGKAELKVILSEVAALFDRSPYIHIGGDEIAFEDSFIIEMLEYVHSLGRKGIIWNRYNSPFKLVDPTMIPVDMTTNWQVGGTLVNGIPNVDMRYKYANLFDSFADLAGMYRSNIFGVQLGTDNVAGAITAFWSDTKLKTYDDIVRQNNLYATVLALCERAWKGGGDRYVEQGGPGIPDSGSEHDEFVDWERRFLCHKRTTLASVAGQIPYVRQSNVRWLITDQIPNGGDADAVLPLEEHMNDDRMPVEFIVGGQTYGVRPATGAGVYLRHQWQSQGGAVKGVYDTVTDGCTAYAWTDVYSPVDQEAGAFIEFYNYCRSGSDRAPDAGHWDRRGSRIWINGEEIPAPIWEQPGAFIPQDHDTQGLANENFTARPVTVIRLKAGWNRVFLKLPNTGSCGTGRDKWQFTFVITDPYGCDALDGLVYSPMR